MVYSSLGDSYIYSKIDIYIVSVKRMVVEIAKDTEFKIGDVFCRTVEFKKLITKFRFTYERSPFNRGFVRLERRNVKRHWERVMNMPSKEFDNSGHAYKYVLDNCDIYELHEHVKELNSFGHGV